MTRRYVTTTAIALVSMTTAVTGCSMTSPTTAPTSPDISHSVVVGAADKFAHSVTEEAIYQHLTSIEKISRKHKRFRSYDSEGYAEAATYVEEKLRAAGYEPRREPFTVVEEVSRESSFTVGEDAMEHFFLLGSPALNEVSAPLVVPAGDPHGCADNSYPEPINGKIALVQRGKCSFTDRARLAKASGAVAVIVVNMEDRLLRGSLVPGDLIVPTVGVSSSIGRRLHEAMAAGTPVRLGFQPEESRTETFSIIAESKGREDSTLMMGAHLDSVPAGPGINDNATGAATILEIAIQYAASGASQNPNRSRIRFAWWGAEEIGLKGSEAWASGQTPEEMKRIKAYLNYDMLGSENYIIGVYDDTYQNSQPAPEGSSAVKKHFTDWFGSKNQPWVPVELDGRSDYGPFMQRGVPIGGLFTGADGSKTAKEVSDFGGRQGKPYDSHYHKESDSLSHINRDGLRIMSAAAAAVAWTMSES